MLKGIPDILSPDLLKVLAEMGHGDEIVIGDGNFPAASVARRLIRADGHGTCELLKAILAVIPLDTYAEPNVVLMEVVPSDPVRPVIWDDYRTILVAAEGDQVKVARIKRFAFYERAKTAYAVIASGESALYANIILKKGVITSAEVRDMMKGRTI
ncbi:MAG: L-fucose mutarotase [Spirochaetaceae bacterium]|jgi:L-fucose mutarotase|nr:L-fucose mutarotase [Spirochaetaceae bacterium]